METAIFKQVGEILVSRGIGSCCSCCNTNIQTAFVSSLLFKQVNINYVSQGTGWQFDVETAILSVRWDVKFVNSEFIIKQIHQFYVSILCPPKLLDKNFALPFDWQQLCKEK